MAFDHAHRDFRRLLAAALASGLGSAMIPVVLSFGLLDLGRTPAEVGWLLGAHALVYALAIVPAGVLADRRSRRDVMILADLLRCACQAAMAVLLLRREAPFALFAALLALAGLGDALFQPAEAGLLPQIVRREQVGRLGSLLGLGQAVPAVLGPLAAGMVVGLGASWLAFALDAASFALSAALLSSIRPAAASRGPDRHVLAEIAVGWREFAGRRWLWATVGLFCVLNLLAMPPLLVLGAALFHQRGDGSVALGGLMACGGVGAVLGAALAFRGVLRRPLAASAALVMLGSPVLVLVALDAPLPLVMVAGAVLGAGLAYSGIAIQTSMQQRIPGDVLSRVTGITQLAALATTPAGFALVAPASRWLGPQTCLLVAAGVVVASGAAVLCVADIRNFAASAATTGEPVEAGKPDEAREPDEK